MTLSQGRSEKSTSVPTEELDGLRLLLREDLEFRLQQYGGEVCYVIEDPVHAAYFRIGLPEYTFLSLLNGRNTVGEAIARCAVAQGSQAISEQEATSICRWLTSNHLATTHESAYGRQLTDSRDQTAREGWRRWLNPLSVSLKLGNPEPLLRRLLPVFGWMHHRSGILLWSLLLLVGLIRLMVDHHSVIRDSAAAVAPANWLWLGLIWLGLKCVHELSHGLCCLVRGGRVRMFGVTFMMFAPMPYVDASSAWRMVSKWQRIQVAFAGIYAELALAALAVIVRSSTDDAVLRMLCLNIILTGGVMTLLFNLNPLARYDGYYILADWLEIPNLAQTARQLTLQLVKRVLFGVKFTHEHSLRRAVFLTIYGILASLWRTVMTVTMILAAEKLFHGAGLPLAALATVLWVVIPFWNGVRYLLQGHLRERPSRLRFAVISGGLLLAALTGGRFVMWSETLQLSAVVDFVPSETVRSRVDGFVRQVLVEPGQSVIAGQLLLTLSNPQIDYEVAELELELSRCRLRQQCYLSTGEIAARQTEDATAESLRVKLDEKRELQADLAVYSPHAGVVIAADLNNLSGRFLVRGEAICLVGHPDQKALRVVIPQDELEPVQARTGQIVEVRFDGETHHPASGRLTSLELRASSELIHPALASTAGGPLAVQIGTAPGENSSQPQWMLTEPCFTGNISIPDEYLTRCGAGQLATITLTRNQSSLLQIGLKKLKQWIADYRSV